MYGLTLTTKIAKKPHVTQVVVDQETIILEPTSQTYFSLNVIGAKIWSLFNTESLTISELADYLKEEYCLDEDKSIHDAYQFIERLLANHLVYTHSS